MKPSSSSQETQAMHKTILAIVAQPLHQSLQDLSQKRPEKKQVQGLLDTLKPYLGQERKFEADKSEIEEWVSLQDGGVARSMRTAIRDQISWLSNIGPAPPPKYTHKLFVFACESLGSDRVLHALLDELQKQTDLGNGSPALDICTAIVAAPLARSSSLSPTSSIQAREGPSTVRDALRFAIAEPQKLLQRTMLR